MGIILFRGSPNKKLLKNDLGSAESNGEATEGRLTALDAAMIGSEGVSCNELFPSGTDETRRQLIGCPMGAMGVIDRRDDELGSSGEVTRLLNIPIIDGELSDKVEGEGWSIGDAFNKEDDEDEPWRISR